MSKQSQPEYVQKIKELRSLLELTQGDFARQLGFTQAAVSGWEGGEKKNAPSREAFLFIGNMAPFPQNLWFWKAAGLDNERWLSATSASMESAKLPSLGDVSRIPLKKLTFEGREETGEFLLLDAHLLPNPHSANAFLLGEGDFGPSFAEGDVLFVEVATGGQLEKPLANQVVLLKFPPRDASREPGSSWPGGLFIGSVNWRVLGSSLALEVGDHIVGIVQGEQFQLMAGVSILGRVLGWFRAKGKSK